MAEPLAEQSIFELKRRLQARGMRATDSRAQVLGVLLRAGRPLTHREVVARLREIGAATDVATVYRNLLDMAEAGVVMRMDLGDHSWRFEARDPGTTRGPHPHFICTSCAAVSCIPEGAVLVAPELPLPGALRRGEAGIAIEGICDDCLASDEGE